MQQGDLKDWYVHGMLEYAHPPCMHAHPPARAHTRVHAFRRSSLGGGVAANTALRRRGRRAREDLEHAPHACMHTRASSHVHGTCMVCTCRRAREDLDEGGEGKFPGGAPPAGHGPVVVHVDHAPSTPAVLGELRVTAEGKVQVQVL